MKYWGWGGGLGVLLVLLIIGIPLSLQIARENSHMRQAKANAAKSIISSICLAVRMYEVDNGKFPDSLQNLVTKGREFNWSGPYLENGIPKDSWGNEFQYSKNGYEFTVTSAGPDGTFGTEDDITGQ